MPPVVDVEEPKRPVEGPVDVAVEPEKKANIEHNVLVLVSIKLYGYGLSSLSS